MISTRKPCCCLPINTDRHTTYDISPLCKTDQNSEDMFRPKISPEFVRSLPAGFVIAAIEDCCNVFMQPSIMTTGVLYVGLM